MGIWKACAREFIIEKCFIFAAEDGRSQRSRSEREGRPDLILTCRGGKGFRRLLAHFGRRMGAEICYECRRTSLAACSCPFYVRDQFL